MKNIIKAKFVPVKEGLFSFGNIESKYSCNSQYFTKEGVEYTPVSGEIHYSRYNPDKWEAELLKMRANGVNTVASYVFWNQHELTRGEYNFEGVRDIKRFVATCKKVGMPLILRSGPWAHGEALLGGFPKWINRMPGKRSSEPKYMAQVKKFWTALYEQIKEFCDGETIIGMQLENEYTGSIDHIFKLRDLAEEIGFKVPFFTMTLWPTNTPTPKILPLLGGYPEAPWHYNKKPLKPNGRFAISKYKTEVEIGEDLIKIKKEVKGSFADYPYAGCEVGPGNQVTAHRRPCIGELDGYGVGFAKYASGMNLMGYYMYHGGSNPNDGLWQESRRTLYPNNYSIIDYDFQAPISKWGELRAQGKRLRMLHTFFDSFDKSACTKQPFFPDLPSKSYLLPNVPQYSVRMNEKGEGYLFVGTYDRAFAYNDGIVLDTAVDYNGTIIDLPKLKLPNQSMFFYPFNMDLCGKHFDYITAQPLAKIEKADCTELYFAKINGIDAEIKSNGDISPLNVDKPYTYTAQGKKVNIILLTHERAMAFYTIDNHVVYCDKTIYFEDGKVYYNDTAGGQVIIDGKVNEINNADVTDKIKLSRCEAVRLPYNSYLYSHGKRHYYKLTFDKDLLATYDDIQVTIDFVGLNLQVFSGKQIVDDHFNTNGKYVFRTGDIKKYLDKDNTLIIKAVTATAFGVSNVYNEINIPIGKVELTLDKAIPVITQCFDLKK